MSDMADRASDATRSDYIKSLLRNYQESAERSLDGPTRGRPDRGPAGHRPMGVSLSRGQPHRRLETALEGETISCFVVGGERRLCVPQILNTILGTFTLSEIHAACDFLRVHIAVADQRQVAVLRRDSVLPATAHGCGLITQSDAQRLCGTLLRGNRVAPASSPSIEPSDSIPVIHRCFGKCVGSLRPSSRLVRCAACRHEFDVEQFVCHSHGGQEARTCHWGFDAANWRRYLQLAGDAADDETLRNYLDYFKNSGRTTSSPERHQVRRITLRCRHVPIHWDKGGSPPPRWMLCPPNVPLAIFSTH